MYRYSKEEKFEQHLELLRSEGLVTFVYGDLDNLEMTTLGESILRQVQDISIDLGSMRVSSRAEVFNPFFTAIPDSTQELQDISNLVIGKEEVEPQNTFRIGDTINWFAFTPPEFGQYQIQVNAAEDEDPMIFLAVKGAEEPIAVDDDSGGGLNAKLNASLEQKEYVIGMQLLDRPAGQVVVKINRQSDQ